MISRGILLFSQVCLVAVSIISTSFCDDTGITSIPTKAETVILVEKVCDRQLSVKKIYRGTSWSYGVFFTGVMALYFATDDEKYLAAANAWAAKNEGRILHTFFRFKRADNLCAAQTFIDLFTVKNDPALLKSTQRTLDAIIRQFPDGKKEWWWCDALYMAPPALAHFAAVTGQSNYLDIMDRMWWESTQNLYDPQEHLYFRDKRFKKGKKNPSSCDNEKIFWARGQGWVIAGIARVLRHLPADHPSRQRYITLFKEMAEKIISLKRKNGLWYPNALCPKQYPYPESSSSALFCYAFAWGVNNDILDRAEYLPVIQSAWQGLVETVDESGKVGWVQKKGFKPAKVTQDDTGIYGVGAFLLAGSEVLKLMD